jgi:hypothetical protein
MARQFNRKQIRALIKESLYQMVYDKPSDMYDEEMADEEMGGDDDFFGDYETGDDDVPYGAADVALKIGHDHRRKRAQRGDD